MPALVDQGAAPSRWGSGVRNQPERVSAFVRNGCPDCSGISVRFRPDYTVRRAGPRSSLGSPGRTQSCCDARTILAMSPGSIADRFRANLGLTPRRAQHGGLRARCDDIDIVGALSGRRGWRGVAHQLLDGGQVGAGVEEVAGVGPAQVVGEMAARPVARVRRDRIWRVGLAAERAAKPEIAAAVDGAEQRPGRVAPQLHPVLQERPDRGGEGHQPLLAPLAHPPEGRRGRCRRRPDEGRRARPGGCPIGRRGRSPRRRGRRRECRRPGTGPGGPPARSGPRRARRGGGCRRSGAGPPPAGSRRSP